MSPFWILLEGAKNDGGGGDNWNYKTMQSSSQINTTIKATPNFLQTRCPSCCPTDSVKALNGNMTHAMSVTMSHQHDSMTHSCKVMVH